MQVCSLSIRREFCTRFENKNSTFNYSSSEVVFIAIVVFNFTPLHSTQTDEHRHAYITNRFWHSLNASHLLINTRASNSTSKYISNNKMTHKQMQNYFGSFECASKACNYELLIVLLFLKHFIVKEHIAYTKNLMFLSFSSSKRYLYVLMYVRRLIKLFSNQNCTVWKLHTNSSIGSSNWEREKEGGDRKRKKWRKWCRACFVIYKEFIYRYYI